MNGRFIRGAWRNAPSPAKLIVAAIAGALLATGGYAIAASKNRTIHGCVQRSTGILYIRANCGRGQSRLVWNQKGPPGPQGKPGPTGPPSPIVTAWAFVGSTGTVVDGNGITAQHTGPGVYNVEATPAVCSQTTDAAAVNTPGAVSVGGSFPEAWANEPSGGKFTVQTGVVSGGAFTPQDSNFDITISC